MKPIKLFLVFLAGAFEGMTGEGTWHFQWPKGWETPDRPDEYDVAVAQEFSLSMPLK